MDVTYKVCSETFSASHAIHNCLLKCLVIGQLKLLLWFSTYITDGIITIIEAFRRVLLFSYLVLQSYLNHILLKKVHELLKCFCEAVVSHNNKMCV